jgi:hypothetical protein
VRRTAVGLGLLLALAACAAPGLGPPPPVAGPAIRVEARREPLDRSNLGVTRIGRFGYAGGIELTSPDSSRLRGLSDLKVWPDGRVLAVSDMGDLLEAHLVLDARGRLAGLREARLRPLTDEDGRPLPALGKNEADAEGVAELANGDRLVSLEGDHRILLYPAAGGPPRRAPAPPESFPGNLGMEALAADPQAGPDGYLVGGEASGRTWTCRLSGGCVEGITVAKPPEAGLTATAPLPGGRRAYLLRSFSVTTGVRVVLRIAAADGATLDELILAPPLTVDNFEGLAALPRPDGSLRLYLLSDDNFSSLQRTLLIAFDWRPLS